MATLDDKVMVNFINWLRIVVFNEDSQDLVIPKVAKFWISGWAQNVNPWGLENEINVWLKIEELADEALSGYEYTYEEDLELLEIDDYENCLS